MKNLFIWLRDKIIKPKPVTFCPYRAEIKCYPGPFCDGCCFEGNIKE